MKLIERFLNSGVYIAMIFTITLISWSFYQETPPHIFNLYSIIGLFVLVALMFFILVFFENTLYITPILISFLFILNKSDMTFDTTTSVGWVYIALALIFLGPIIHYLRYKPKIKKGHFSLGLLLIAISYVLSLLFLPFDINAIPVSMMGFIYLGFYIFLLSTAKANIDYIFKIMIFANILLTAQVGLYIYRGYIANPELAFIDRLFIGWGRNLGWANVNDMCFYIALTFPSYLYFIYKKPYHMYLWIIMIIPVILVFLTESRGGLIGFAISFIGIIAFNLIKGHVMQLIQMLVFLTVIGIIFYIYQEAAIKWWDRFLLSFGEDLNDFSTGRIEIYQQGLSVFKAHPLFGGGWLSLQQLNPGSRLFMYHSTLVQSLAAMGIFGLFALLVHYFQVITFFFKKITLEKSLFIIGYAAAQIHGLIDNVQYAVPFSLLMVIIFALWEKSEKDTLFDIKDHRYISRQA
jgi:O-antigen ligase